jgi:hypothetical protein
MATNAIGQGKDAYDGGLTVKLNEDASKYFRFITWNQVWMEANVDGTGLQTDFTLRRSRVLMYAQINKHFLILTHFGVNRLNVANMGTMSPTARPGAHGQFLMHDAWAEYLIFDKKLHVGAGLHYWNGVSRLSNQSTLRLLTLDAPAFNWFHIGTSGQLARHLGMYAKGRLGKFDYRIAYNEALLNPVRGRTFVNTPGASYYGNQEGSDLASPQGKVLTGYFNYQFLDAESNRLPAFSGTYLGAKRVFNVGGGFYAHFNAIGINDREGMQIARKEDALTLGFDVFYDTPLGSKHAALTLYGVLYQHDWGHKTYGGTGGVGTGTIGYAQAGYVLPTSKPAMLRIQPYASYAMKDLEGLGKSLSDFNIGTNLFFYGHHSKLTIEYRRRENPVFLHRDLLSGFSKKGSLLVQATVWL